MVCDIDGTLADGLRRFKEAGPEPDRHDKKAYLKWLDAVQNEFTLLADPPIYPILNLLKTLEGNADICYLTSRFFLRLCF